MEERTVPAGLDVFAHRGPTHLVRLLPGSKMLEIVNDFSFIPDPSDATTFCLPHDIIEGVYGRLFAPDASVEAADLQFGLSHIEVDQLLIAEQSLPTDFDSSICGLDAYVRRVAREAMRPGRQTLTLRAADFADSQPFAPADGPDECWLSEVAISDLVDSNGFLSTYGDLAMLVGPRYMRATRLLSSDSWYSASMVFVARQICALDDDLTAAPARAAIAAVAAVPAGRGGAGRGGRGRGVGVPAVPAVAYAPMPSSAIDEDIRLGFPEWLNQSALPVELASVPRNRRNARLEMQAQARYAASAVQREAVIRARLHVFLQSLTHLEQIVRGVPLSAQLGLIGRLAIELQQSPDSTSVASYQALNDEAGKYVHVLQEGGGPSSVAPDQRVQLVLDEHAAEAMRRRASQAPSGVIVAAGAGGGSQPAASSLKAPAFSRVNHDSLERFVRRNSVAFMAAMNTPESPAFSAIGSLGPLGDKDPHRILRVAFSAGWGVTFLQFVPADKNCGHQMFDCVAPYRHHIYTYVSSCVFQNADGTLDDDLTRGLLRNRFVDDVLAGKSWESLDLFGELEAKLRSERSTVPRVTADTSWPSGVFRDENLLKKVQQYGDALFSALGYRRRSSSGFHGCIEHLIGYLNKHDSAEDNPQEELYGIYCEFMRDAMGYFKTAIESTADAEFPVFSNPNPAWLRRITDLTKSAMRRTADRKREGAAGRVSASAASAASAATGASVHWPSKFVNVNVDGAKRSSSPTNSVTSVDGASPAKASRYGAGAMGSETWRVKVNNASTLRILFPDRNSVAGSMWEYDKGKCAQYLKRQEGTSNKCMIAAVARTANLRGTLCPYAGQPGHTHPNDTAHTFTGEPWLALNTPEYARRLYDGHHPRVHVRLRFRECVEPVPALRQRRL